ncbi:DUF2478 domain-containing protein [Rhodopseudomonas palustris]|uniref:DUF2478 domain-containing protein n=1 Tax=Rhodopseudomonas palustris TaxID=1076 RepID=A0A418UY63_RHOPL|nr:DUF2478 domain-containing protein [Rhodopseudomonas palustris]RJF67390.1 DUF2478 domain-containing protein [Rhodopseudomonas palustris]
MTLDSHTFDSQCDLAALVYEPGEDPDALLQGFADDLSASGDRVVGLVQFGDRLAGATRSGATLLHSGERVPLYQNLGAHAAGCRLDPGQLLAAGDRIGSAMDDGADLVIINRFGQQECEGRGLLHLIVRAISADIPVVIAVPAKRFDAWIRFAEGMSVRLRCDRGALDAWWASLSARGRSSAARPHTTLCEAFK